MNPLLTSLGLFALEEAIKQEPAIADELQQLFSSGKVTPEMLAALRAKVSSESYAGFVPKSQLPPDANDNTVAADDAAENQVAPVAAEAVNPGGNRFVAPAQA